MRQGAIVFASSAKRRKPGAARLAARALGLAAGLWASAGAAYYSENELPDNPLAIAQCQARVRVEVARVREAPSLKSPVKELRLREESFFVTRITGKWAEIVLENGDTAYMAAYLLVFPAHEILDHWKKQAPQPTVGKKAKVKWASVNFRKYPSAGSVKMGVFEENDVLAELWKTQDGWSMVQCEGGAVGFVATSALAPIPVLPEFPDWGPPLSAPETDLGETLEPLFESPSDYLSRTVWSPEIFAHALKTRDAAPVYLASR